MPFERLNGVIKGFVRNRARPDGSIVQGFLTEECISFCTNFLELETNPVGLPVNKHLGKLLGSGHRNGRRDLHVDFEGRRADFDRANLVALQHLDMVDDYLTEHQNSIRKKYSDRGKTRTEGEIIRAFVLVLRVECESVDIVRLIRHEVGYGSMCQCEEHVIILRYHWRRISLKPFFEPTRKRGVVLSDYFSLCSRLASVTILLPD